MINDEIRHADNWVQRMKIKTQVIIQIQVWGLWML